MPTWPAFTPPVPSAQQQYNEAARNIRDNGYGQQNAVQPRTFIPAAPEVRDAQLVQWEHAKKQLDYWKAEEMRLRKQAVDMNFAPKDDPTSKTGVNTVELANGFALKATRKITYTLVKPEGYEGQVIDAVEECMENFVGLSNEGSFLADRLFKWSVDINTSEYKKLQEEAAYSPLKKRMLDEVNKVLVIDEGAPTLVIAEQKRKK
jgi:hypothetical protein